MTLFLSIIIPTYNREKLVMRAINSVLNNNKLKVNFKYEIIVVDDCSSDNTKLTLKTLIIENKIKYYFLKKNQGVNGARNYGIEKSNGDYILFLDSDDSLIENSFETIFEIINKYNKYKVFFFGVQNSESKKLMSYSKNKLSFVDYSTYLNQEKISGEFLPVVKKEIFDEVKFDTSRYAFEGLLWTNIAKKFNIVIYNEPLRKYYFDANNRITKTLFDKKNFEKRISDYRTYLDLFGKDMLSLNLNLKYSKYLNIIGVYTALFLDTNFARLEFKKSLNLKFTFSAFLLYLLSFFGKWPFKIIIYISKRNA